MALQIESVDHQPPVMELLLGCRIGRKRCYYVHRLARSSQQLSYVGRIGPDSGTGGGRVFVADQQVPHTHILTNGHPTPAYGDGAIDSLGEKNLDQRHPEATDVAIIVPAYRAAGTLKACVQSLLNQDFPGRYEVIVCASGGAETDSDLEALLADPRLRLIRNTERLPAGVARNTAAAAAAPAVSALAFTDADVIASTDWLTQLWKASNRRMCVAGAVLNGTPDSRIGTAEYLLEFIDLHPARPAVHFGATCNLLVPMSLWRTYGPFDEDLDGGEDTLLTARLRQEHKLAFCPNATVRHLNRTRFMQYLAHQYQFGCFCARLARRTQPTASTPSRSALQRHPLLAPVAGGGKVVWVLYRALAADAVLARAAVRCLPEIVMGVGAWTVGLLWEGLRARRAAPAPAHLD